MLREIEIPRNELLDTLANSGKVTGFVSPAEDYIKRRLHIASRLVPDPTNTFYFEVDSNDMQSYGIFKGSILVVDKSVTVKSGRVVVCCLDHQWLVRKLFYKGTTKYLCINETLIGSVEVSSKRLEIFGCVTWSCLPQNDRR